jgi:hypothetical protein
MKSRALRAVFVLLALAAQAGAGYQVWRVDDQISAARSGATDFDRKARLAVLALSDIRAAQQAYVAEGQASDIWLARVDGLVQATAPRLSELRVAAIAAEAQGGLEAAVESFSAFGPSDAKARDYVRSGQRLSASDVIFTDGASLLTKATNAIDTSRGQESVAREIGIAVLRQQLLYWIGGAALVTLLVLLLLFPIPMITAGAGTGKGTETVDAGSSSFGGLGISKVAPDRRASLHELAPGLAAGETAAPASGSGPGPAAGESAGPDLQAVADICSAFALVEDPGELHGLLERIARALEATGLIIWMPDNQQGPLRQVLACGYAPLSLTRMGTIDPSADNATAIAFRTKSVQVVATEAHSSGAIVAPLVTSDGCSGTLSVELKEGVRITPQLKAVATILAAQLATLITPSAQGGTQEPPAARL